ncbi:SMI1/KNR4 family protein [Nocardia vinacea]|uniref:SMI1/KNR4 family protein n=1 Tax=Nocardia vinacea TaxID=96468 RepID=UPI00340DB312
MPRSGIDATQHRRPTTRSALGIGHPCSPSIPQRAPPSPRNSEPIVFPPPSSRAATVGVAARTHNGGYPARSAHPTDDSTTWAADHVAVTSLAAIGRTANFSLCGETGSRFWLQEWGYPDIGIYFADCPSAGHDMIGLDYRSNGEPSVVHIDSEAGYRITKLAPDFATFINGLVRETDFHGQ